MSHDLDPRATWRRDGLPEDRFLARELAAMANPNTPAERQAIVVLVEALLMQCRTGSTCLPLPPDPGFHAALQDSGGDLAAIETARRLLQAMLSQGSAGSSLVASASPLESIVGTSDRHPIVLGAFGIQLQRYHRLEAAVANAVQTRFESRPGQPDGSSPATPPPYASRALREVLGGSPGQPKLSEEQREAVQGALASRLHCVTGGPGTGKTSIVVAVVRSLARLPAGPYSGSQIALAAPTGKAADRLQDSLQKALFTLSSDHPAEERLRADPPSATTLHRLLRVPRDGARPRYHRGLPLPYRYVIVDEASMVDLQRFEWLLEALAPSSQLLLLGDADQLPSVEPGAVFRDLVHSVPERHVTRLTRSYRQDAKDPSGRAILDLAAAVHRGDSAGCLERVNPVSRARRLTLTGTERLDAMDGTALESFLETWYERIACPPPIRERLRRTYRIEAAGWSATEALLLRELFDHFAGHRLLAPAHGYRDGRGTTGLNRWFQRRLSPDASSQFYPGQPVLITRNQPHVGLRNGDLGLVLWVQAAEAARPRPSVVVPQAEGLMDFELIELRSALQPAWATTVHKSQGSEYDRVAIVLDAEGGGGSRELLYTAVTRARQGVVLVASADQVQSAVQRRSMRTSTLSERLESRMSDADPRANQGAVPLARQTRLF